MVIGLFQLLLYMKSGPEIIQKISCSIQPGMKF